MKRLYKIKYYLLDVETENSIRLYRTKYVYTEPKDDELCSVVEQFDFGSDLAEICSDYTDVEMKKSLFKKEKVYKIFGYDDKCWTFTEYEDATAYDLVEIYEQWNPTAKELIETAPANVYFAYVNDHRNCV